MKKYRTDLITFLLLAGTIFYLVDFNDLGFLDYAILGLGVIWTSLTIFKWVKQK